MSAHGVKGFFHGFQPVFRGRIADHHVVRAEEFCRDRFQVADQLRFMLFEMFLDLFNNFVIPDAVCIVLELGDRRSIGQGAERRRRMAGREEGHLEPGFQHGQDLFQPLLIIQLRLHQDLPHHGKEHIHLRIQGFSFHFKCGAERLFFYFRHIRVQLQRGADAAGVHVDLVKKFSVFIVRGVDDPQHALQDPHIRKLLFPDAGQVEHEGHIPDAVGLHIVVDHLYAVYFPLIVIDRCDLPGNVGALQHRNLRQVLRRGLLFLVGFQLFCIPDELLHFFCGEAFLICLQFFRQFPVHPRGASLLRTDDHDGSVGIVKQPGPDQILKISRLHLALQEFKCRDGLHVDKRFLFIIKPAVEKLQPVHQAPRIAAEIRLAETEFIVINAGTERFFINAVLRQIPERIFHHPDKRFLLFHIGALGDHREDRLVYAIIVRSHDILANAGVQQRFLKRRARRGQKGIVQDLESQIQLLIQRSADHLIVGKIGII